MAPPDFNRIARLQRQNVGTIAYTADVSAQSLDLPPVGYHYRLLAHADLDTTAAGVVTGRWLSGHIGGNTNRFRAPFGLVKGIRYALNVSSPVYYSDGYGNHLLQLAERKGLDPFVQVATSSVGYARKERSLCAIFNATDGALVAPDAVLVAAKNYKLRFPIHIPLTLGDAALVGLVPVQDIRIRPQLILDFGGKGDVASVAADLGTITGNFTVFCDYFTVPNEAVRPDTSFVFQTLMDIQQVAGTGDQDYRPQIGGVIMRVIQAIFNSSKGIDAYSTIEERSLIVQQGVYLQRESPIVSLYDERRYQSKILPDEALLWDFTTGAGDPTMPSLRDRLPTSQATWLTLRNKWGSGTAVAATAEIRSYRQQMVPVDRVMG